MILYLQSSMRQFKLNTNFLLPTDDNDQEDLEKHSKSLLQIQSRKRIVRIAPYIRWNHCVGDLSVDLQEASKN